MKDFLNSVRMPYQDAIVFATRLYDFHIEQSMNCLLYTSDAADE